MIENIDIANTIIGYEEYLRRKGRKESTINVYMAVIKKFVKNGYDFEKYSDYNKFLEDHTIKKRSFHYYDIMLGFVKWYFPKEKKTTKNLIIDTIKMTQKNVKDPIKQSVTLTPEQQQYIIANMGSKKHSLICWIQKETGVRAGDVIRLKKDRVEFSYYKDNNGKVYLTLEISFIKKGDKISKIPIFNIYLIEYLKERIYSLDPNEEYLFIDRDIVYERHRQDDFKLYRKNYYDYWQDLHKTCEMVGVDPKKFSTHDWRRNFANKIWTDVLNKKDIEALRRALGHAHIDTTVRYLRHSGMESQDVFKKSFDLEK